MNLLRFFIRVGLLGGFALMNACTPTPVEPPRIESIEQAQEWLGFYYLNPRPGLTLSALEKFSQAHALNEAADRFFGHVFSQNSELLLGWVEELKKSEWMETYHLWKILWYANTAESVRVLELEIKAAGLERHPFLSEPPPDLLDNVQLLDAVQKIEETGNSGDLLDQIWVSFHATGKKEYVRQIVRFVSPEVSILGMTAEWSLVNYSIAEMKRSGGASTAILDALRDARRDTEVEQIRARLDAAINEILERRTESKEN